MVESHEDSFVGQMGKFEPDPVKTLQLKITRPSSEYNYEPPEPIEKDLDAPPKVKNKPRNDIPENRASGVVPSKMFSNKQGRTVDTYSVGTGLKNETYQKIYDLGKIFFRLIT